MNWLLSTCFANSNISKLIVIYTLGFAETIGVGAGTGWNFKILFVLRISIISGILRMDFKEFLTVINVLSNTRIVNLKSLESCISFLFRICVQTWFYINNIIQKLGLLYLLFIDCI